MVSPVPRGRGPETSNKCSPRERGYYHPPVCGLTVLQSTALTAPSPRVHPKVTAYWNLVFYFKKRRRRRSVRSSHLDSLIIKPFHSPGVLQ